MQTRCVFVVVVFRATILHFGRWLVRGLMTRSLLSDVFWVERYVLCRLAWLFVGTLLSLAHSYAGCDPHWIVLSVWLGSAKTKVFRLGQRSEASSESETTSRALYQYQYVQIMFSELFSANVNLKMFCILCLLILCTLFYAAKVKRPKIWPLFWNKVSFCRVCLLSFNIRVLVYP